MAKEPTQDEIEKMYETIPVDSEMGFGQSDDPFSSPLSNAYPVVHGPGVMNHFGPSRGYSSSSRTPQRSEEKKPGHMIQPTRRKVILEDD